MVGWVGAVGTVGVVGELGGAGVGAELPLLLVLLLLLKTWLLVRLRRMEAAELRKRLSFRTALLSLMRSRGP